MFCLSRLWGVLCFEDEKRKVVVLKREDLKINIMRKVEETTELKLPAENWNYSRI